MKRTFLTIFILTAVILAVLPFLTTFTDLFTQLIMRIEVYRRLQNLVIPYELRLVGTLINALGIPTAVGNTFIQLQVGGREEVIHLAWNCVGWQSLAIFLVTLMTGLSGNFTWLSKLECLLIGILGTFFLNIARIVFSILAIAYVNQVFAYVLHDYLMVLITILWLFFFWWFSFAFVLEEAESVDSNR